MKHYYSLASNQLLICLVNLYISNAYTDDAQKLELAQVGTSISIALMVINILRIAERA